MPSSSAGRVRRTARSRALRVAAVGALAVAGLAACDKPSPGVTVVSGSVVARSEALCWNDDPAPVENCGQDVIDAAVNGDRAEEIPVVSGSIVGIDVDHVVADLGWRAGLGTESLVSGPVTTTYYRFEWPSTAPVPAEGVVLTVIALTSDQKTRGVWVFRLVPATGE